MTWTIVEGSIDEPNSLIAIADGVADAEVLSFPGTTDEDGLRILAQCQCDDRNRAAIDEATEPPIEPIEGPP